MHIRQRPLCRQLVPLKRKKRKHTLSKDSEGATRGLGEDNWEGHRNWTPRVSPPPPPSSTPTLSAQRMNKPGSLYRLFSRSQHTANARAKLHSEEDRNWNSSSKAPHDRNGNPKLGKFKYRPASKMKTKQSQLQAWCVEIRWTYCVRWLSRLQWLPNGRTASVFVTSLMSKVSPCL